MHQAAATAAKLPYAEEPLHCVILSHTTDELMQPTQHTPWSSASIQVVTNNFGFQLCKHTELNTLQSVGYSATA